ncbi:hypothetical protein [Shinella sp.]
MATVETADDGKALDPVLHARLERHLPLLIFLLFFLKFFNPVSAAMQYR